jgi:uncharacterized protein (DUF427 family)
MTATSRPVLIPGPDHPITITPAGTRVRALVGDVEIASSTNALVLQEADYPPVYYIPREDADASLLTRTDNATYCPYKGDASYFSITTESGVLTNAVWSYETPYDAMSEIVEHLAFYTDRVSVVAD